MADELNQREPIHTRRGLLATGGIAAASIALAGIARADQATSASSAKHEGATGGKPTTNMIKTTDGTELYFKDSGVGRPIVFSHGWPLTADAWDSQMYFLANHGYRVIAHDRRSHGRSMQTWGGNDMDTYADDLAAVLDALDVKGAMLVGHSTGGGEVARYIGRHGIGRVSKAVLISSVPPIMVKSDSNPVGLDIKIFDGLRAATIGNRSQFFRDLAMPFYGYNQPGAKVSQGIIDSFWLQGMMGGFKGQVDCIKQFSETDFTGDLKKITVPMLLLHGDADQIVPIAGSSMLSAKIIPNAKLKVYAGAPHGMCTTHADQINADLLLFAEA